MRITFYPMVFMYISTALHIILASIFVKGLGMGIEGLALSQMIKNFVLMIMTMITSMTMTMSLTTMTRTVTVTMTIAVVVTFFLWV